MSLKKVPGTSTQTSNKSTNKETSKDQEKRNEPNKETNNDKAITAKAPLFCFCFVLLENVQLSACSRPQTRFAFALDRRDSLLNSESVFVLDLSSAQPSYYRWQLAGRCSRPPCCRRKKTNAGQLFRVDSGNLVPVEHQF